MATPYDHGTSSVNPPSTPAPPGDWTAGVIAGGGGWLPPDGSGEFTAPLMARFLGIDERTVRRLVTEKAIPVREIAGQMWITAEAIRSACPAKPWEGRRKKKE